MKNALQLATVIIRFSLSSAHFTT